MDKKKTFVLLRRNREQVTISSNSKSSPQETSTCQDTDMTSSINVGSKETISINLCEKCFRFGMTDRSTFPCKAKRYGPSHKGAVKSVPEGHKLVHGQKLVCKHDQCKASSLYCALGNHAVPYSSFGYPQCDADFVKCSVHFDICETGNLLLVIN